MNNRLSQQFDQARPGFGKRLISGFPFEVAKHRKVHDVYRTHGFSLARMRGCAGGHGCNEFVFQVVTDRA